MLSVILVRFGNLIISVVSRLNKRIFIYQYLYIDFNKFNYIYTTLLYFHNKENVIEIIHVYFNVFVMKSQKLVFFAIEAYRSL